MRVKQAVSVPVAVKLSPYFSSTGESPAGSTTPAQMRSCSSIVSSGPTSIPYTLAAARGIELSSPIEALLPRTWIGLLYGRVNCSLAATTGVETAADIAKYLLAGADVVMTASSLLRHGPEHATVSPGQAGELDG